MRLYLVLIISFLNILISYSHCYSAEDRVTMVSHDDSRIISWSGHPGAVTGRPPGEYLGNNRVKQIVGHSTYVKNLTYDKIFTVTVGFRNSGRYYTKVVTSFPGSETLVYKSKKGRDSYSDCKIVGVIEGSCSDTDALVP